jgi:hypothetical protein
MQRIWKKLGRVFVPSGRRPMCTHAMLPTPMVIDDRIRVFFASCDDTRRGRVFYLDVDASNPQQVLTIESRPVLDLGTAGSFDADGVNPCHVEQRGEELLLYYIGWRRGTPDVPYFLFTGLAASRDGGLSFSRVSTQPILGPCCGEQYFRTAPHVHRGRDGWQMFYIGGNEFFDGVRDKRLPLYSLRRICSRDGITWPTPGEELLRPNRDRGEIGFGRPFLWHNAVGQPSLLISVRWEKGYQLHEVELTSGEIASAPRPMKLEGTTEAWDAEMTCFGAACRAGDKELLFYNGNNYGESGIGVAVRPLVATNEMAALIQDQESPSACLNAS